MEITGASIKQHKQRGEWAELRFMARASEHGLSVSKPWGDSCRYDFIVEHAGKLVRVQVKSTVCQKRKSYAYHVNGRPYTSGEIDFLAIYIIPKNIWYIFPAEVISKFTRNVILSPHMKVAKHGAYKEAWHLLRSEEPATHTGPSPALSAQIRLNSDGPEPRTGTEVPYRAA